MDPLLVSGIVVSVIMFAAIWLLTQGATINASSEVEGKSSIWGVLLTGFGAFLMVLDLLFVILLVLGGEGGMIPESAWPLLTGSITMIGAGFAAALCIMVAAKAGATEWWIVTQQFSLYFYYSKII